jgi:Trehalose receptor
MRFWTKKETNFLQYPYKVTTRLSTKIKIVAGIILTLAFLEHVLFLTNEIYQKYKFVERCNCTDELTLSYFLDHQFNFIFKRIQFNLPFGIFVEIFNFSLTLSWNYMDLFVMMISIALVTRFNQINTRIVETVRKVRTCSSLSFSSLFHRYLASRSRSLSVNQRGSRFVLTMFSSVNLWRKLITNSVFSSFFLTLTTCISFATNCSTFTRKLSFTYTYM